MFEDIKMLMEIEADDTTQDKSILYHMNTIKQKILNYTGQQLFPNELEYLVTEIVVDRLNNTNPNVKVVKDGNTTIEYSQNELYPYRQELELYKTIRIV